MRLKKNYHTKDLKSLIANGAYIKRDYSTDTYGTSSMGYMERIGLLINGKQYQVVYTSKGYGRITSDIVYYNGRFLEKHIQYMEAVEKHFTKNVLELINK